MDILNAQLFQIVAEHWQGPWGAMLVFPLAVALFLRLRA